ncbi:MAG: O-antigen ligase family protein [Patescibacteria group bacterium]
MSNILLKLIKFGIGFILFIPLYVGSPFFFPFIFPKIWLFSLVTEIIFFLYIVLAVSSNNYRPKINLVFWALVLLTLVLVITSFTGIDAFRSFWGNTERMSGIIYWIHFAVFAIILGGVLKTEKEWKNFFGIAVIVSVLEFFYVLAQYFEVSWTWLPGSLIGTIGNTDLLAIYAIFGAFFSLYLWRGLKISETNTKYQILNTKYKWIWAVAFFLNIGTLFLASSRGAMLGFGSGIFIYILFQAWQKPQIRKKLVILILTPFILYGFIWLNRDSDFVKNTSQLTRITNVSIKDDTVQQRFTEWGIAWDAFAAKPILGWGPNTYLYLHNAYLDPLVYDLRETNFDRAHNAYLDYASMSGIIGLLGYLFLIGVLFWTFFKKDMHVWAALIIAYAVSSFFVFDSPASYIALFLTIGFAMFVANNESGNSKFSPQIVVALSLVAFILSLYLIWQVSYKSAMANVNFASAFSGIGSGALTPAQAFLSYQKSLKYETLGASEFRNQYSQWLRTGISRFAPEERLVVVDFGINELEKEVKDHPLVFSYLNLGQIYYFKSMGAADESLKFSIWQKSAEAYEKALELAPKRLEVYYSYLQLALAAKDYNRAIELTKKTTEVAPDYGQNWWYLGIAYISAGREEEAISAINHALDIWYSRHIAIAEKDGSLDFDIGKAAKVKYAVAPKQEILGVVNIYIKTSRWKELLLLYLGAEAEDSSDVGIHQSLAIVYQNLGLTDKALEELKIVENLSPK